MPQFAKIVVLGAGQFEPECRAAVQALSAAPVQWVDRSEIKDTILDPACDALLVSLRIDVSVDRLDLLPKLRYVGVYGTNLQPVDQRACAARGIAVTNVHGYCDPETAEWCLAVALDVLRGTGPVAVDDAPRSLFGQGWGIFGVGAVGIEVAKRAVALGADTRYYSRTQRDDIAGARFCDRSELLANARIISLHVPPNTTLFSAADFDRLRPDVVVINTCIGHLYDNAQLRAFLDKGRARWILDGLSALYHEDVLDHPSVVHYAMRAHTTFESDERRRHLFIRNMTQFLDSNSASA